MASLYDTYTLMQAMEALDRPTAFVRDTFFGNRAFSEDRKIVIDEYLLDRSMAGFVSFSIAAEGRKPVVTKSSDFDAPPVVERTGLDPTRARARRPGEPFSGGMTAAQRFELSVLDELQRQDYRITRLEEWMACQVLIAGAITRPGEGVSVSVDFARDAALRPATLTGTARWGQSAADPIGNIETWAGVVAAKSGSVVTNVLLGTEAATLFKRNADVKALLDNRRQIDGSMQLGPQAVGGQGREVVPIGEIDGIMYWVHAGLWNDGSADQPFFPRKGIALVGDIAGTLAYAAVPTKGEGDGSVTLVAGDRVPQMFSTDMPIVENVVTRSAPLTIPGRPNAVLYTEVTGAS
jgi:hypothetical protein